MEVLEERSKACGKRILPKVIHVQEGEIVLISRIILKGLLVQRKQVGQQVEGCHCAVIRAKSMMTSRLIYKI